MIPAAFLIFRRKAAASGRLLFWLFSVRLVKRGGGAFHRFLLHAVLRWGVLPRRLKGGVEAQRLFRAAGQDETVYSAASRSDLCWEISSSISSICW